MPHQNQDGGRNVVPPEESRPSWRPDDRPDAPWAGGRDDDDERGWRARGREDERRGDRDLRRGGTGRGGELGYASYAEERDPESAAARHGQGGYGAGRYGEDRLHQLQGREPGRDDFVRSAGSFEDRHRETGGPPGRGSYWLDHPATEPERYAGQGGYGGRDFEHERHELARAQRSRDERLGYPVGAYSGDDERMGYPAGSYHRRDEELGSGGSYPRGEERMGPAGAYGRSHAGYAGSLSGTQDTARHDLGIAAHVHRGTGPHRGKGPIGYQRSDERLREMVCESLTDDDQVDASNIEVTVSHGEVTLSGTVDTRRAKRDAEDCACSVPGVRDVQNLLRVQDDSPSRDSIPGKASAGRGETSMSAHDEKHRA